MTGLIRQIVYMFSLFLDSVSHSLKLGGGIKDTVGSSGSNPETISILTIRNLLYITDPASGTAADWYKSEAKARFAFTIELRDTGYHGFALPANQIIPRYRTHLTLRLIEGLTLISISTNVRLRL